MAVCTGNFWLALGLGYRALAGDQFPVNTLCGGQVSFKITMGLFDSMFVKDVIRFGLALFGSLFIHFRDDLFSRDCFPQKVGIATF